jgi:hypothetical protein
VSQVLPEGIDSLSDCPFTLHEAILTALRILNYEEFPREERPPRNIWLDGDKLNEWWEEIERQRDAKYKGDTEPAVDESDWEQNAVELVKRG